MPCASIGCIHLLSRTTGLALVLPSISGTEGP
ncbi:Uncharacterised protein [Vibrio cholerae]|nr:Uncharacterised protein [Vibrio cholerae]